VSRFSALALLAFGLALASTAQAEAPPADASGSDGERANELFRNAKLEFASGNLHEAHRLYSSAWELRKSPDIAANLAQTELELGRMSAAAQHFSYALRNLLPSSTEQQRAALEQGLATARAQVCALRLTITPSGAEVFIDGAPVGTAPINDPIFVEPGERAILAKRDGFVTAEARPLAQKGAEQTVELVLAEGAAAAPAPPAEPVSEDAPMPSRADPPSLVPAYIATGVALAGLGVGVAFVIVANGSADDVAKTRRDLGAENSCGSGTPFVEQCETLKDDVAARDTATTIAVAGFAVGALSGGLATYLFLNASSSSASRATTLVPSVALAPNAGSIALRGRF
jgi:PEGA domain